MIRKTFFFNLAKSAINIYGLPLGEHFLPILSNILKIFHWIMLEVLLEAGQQ